MILPTSIDPQYIFEVGAFTMEGHLGGPPCQVTRSPSWLVGPHLVVRCFPRTLWLDLGSKQVKQLWTFFFRILMWFCWLRTCDFIYQFHCLRSLMYASAYTYIYRYIYTYLFERYIVKNFVHDVFPSARYQRNPDGFDGVAVVSQAPQQLPLQRQGRTVLGWRDTNPQSVGEKKQQPKKSMWYIQKIHIKLHNHCVKPSFLIGVLVVKGPMRFFFRFYSCQEAVPPPGICCGISSLSNVHSRSWREYSWSIYGLVGGFNPFEKYARQIGSFPQGSGWEKIFETTTWWGTDCLATRHCTTLLAVRRFAEKNLLESRIILLECRSWPCQYSEIYRTSGAFLNYMTENTWNMSIVCLFLFPNFETKTSYCQTITDKTHLSHQKNLICTLDLLMTFHEALWWEFTSW